MLPLVLLNVSLCLCFRHSITFSASSLIICLIFLVFAGLEASHSLHAPLIHSVMRSPMEFFDTTPIGRILNRCAKDVEVLDTQLPMNFRQMVVSFMQVSSQVFCLELRNSGNLHPHRDYHCDTTVCRGHRSTGHYLLLYFGKWEGQGDRRTERQRDSE